ncbi:MAG: Translation initiation factor IF-1 [Parcubacteria group bacterium GW2011_GWA2_42_28]|nr:MAG: Translation initiation factor IF-1 [Parcubacteria group bacterium GW2011_GWA2_42_28]KKT55448.1 MAG: Translation initiation factor IF-1 [Parcubacteria group bacterium GW2011_GWC2_44_22]
MGRLNFKINKKGFIETKGLIKEALPAATFKVMLENGHEVFAILAGKMRLNRIMLVPGDQVKLEMSQYDLTKARITYRF